MLRARAAVLLAATVSLSLFLSPQTAGAATQRPFPVITTTGEGAVTVSPDLAVATAGVTTEAKTPREAADANTRTMNAVVAAAVQAGIPENDVRTARFSIYPVHSQKTRDGAPQVSGYRAINQVQVKVRDIVKVGELLDQLLSAGATNIAGVEFSVSNPTPRLDEARNAAFAEAKRKAELYARAASAQVGRAVAISEGEADAPRPMAFRAAAAGSPAPPPIAAGEETLRVQVTVTFELLQ
jgi:uncharacterized protein YggE